MKCEIYGPDKKRKAYTDSAKCVPDEKTLRQLRAAGYTIYVDGKRWTPRNGKEDDAKQRAR